MTQPCPVKPWLLAMFSQFEGDATSRHSCKQAATCALRPNTGPCKGPCECSQQAPSEPRYKNRMRTKVLKKQVHPPTACHSAAWIKAGRAYSLGSRRPNSSSDSSSSARRPSLTSAAAILRRSSAPAPGRHSRTDMGRLHICYIYYGGTVVQPTRVAILRTTPPPVEHGMRASMCATG